MQSLAPKNAQPFVPDDGEQNKSTAIYEEFTLNDRSAWQPLKVLSEDDWNFWVRNGYIVIKQAVPKAQVERLAKLIWEFEEKDPDNPNTWYAPPRALMEMKELHHSGMVEIFNHQYLWDNRQTPRVHDAFADIWGTEKLWVTIDRANLNLPLRPGHDFKGFMHWDYDPETKPQNVQGVLALSDQTDENIGGFQCVPELFRTYETWKLTQPKDRDRFKPDISGFEVVKVKLEPGDLLIFNSLLAHGIRPNRSVNKVRMAQYLSMMPARGHDEKLRQWRIESWQKRKTPEGYAFPGDPRKWEEKHYETAKLTELGERLLGLRKWS
ncbi:MULTISPECIES: phytanoyl-CoA dioxygenase family protein [unclassified Imperialibacter]|uniref:phytanoyl-CoA dioxygenase family protein n=1 Tax=unclassified Imperialibacter TaxID=2629706 RepID=UPI001259A450|nr:MULTISPECIES: phytanoyl-CoA dioxygenase family protein [unclassified Imperialibacter]CAD5252171.1 Ectoine hydroxylase-related dioxygenase (Phytanoyl-CoA dioxygenase family) [Imperialibacter sp. 75]CAD5298241.1 Ectoine hydroxylase-related dioxygenase (Phytanoyl-CoA dioxygenase family) [Imperialibacter sp. 89]VVT13507.1 conserved hypothetical protein [Imperialibacter sp. EC-SDR9]